jgi:hypothetical protein
MPYFASQTLSCPQWTISQGLGNQCWNPHAFRSGFFAPVYIQDATELLHFAAFPPDSVMIVISRGGQSAEIIGLLAKSWKNGTKVVGLTTPCSDR